MDGQCTRQLRTEYEYLVIRAFQNACPLPSIPVLPSSSAQGGETNPQGQGIHECPDRWMRKVSLCRSTDSGSPVCGNSGPRHCGRRQLRRANPRTQEAKTNQPEPFPNQAPPPLKAVHAPMTKEFPFTLSSRLCRSRRRISGVALQFSCRNWTGVSFCLVRRSCVRVERTSQRVSFSRARDDFPCRFLGVSCCTESLRGSASVQRYRLYGVIRTECTGSFGSCYTWVSAILQTQPSLTSRLLAVAFLRALQPLG